MDKKLFIISDVHAEHDLLLKLLKLVDEDEHQIVFLGDLIDRGPSAKATIYTVKQLVEEKNAICLTGNHEDIFLQWLDAPEEKMDWYLRNGGQATIESLLYVGVFDEESPVEMAAMIKSRYPDIVSFFQQLPLYYETEHVICVHAGINLLLEDWHETSRRDFIWIREAFHHAQNTTNKHIVFGHTPVQGLHGNLFNTGIWYHQHKIGIDGGAVYQGALHGLVMDKDSIEADYQIFNPQHKFEKYDNMNTEENAE
ncbi:metallophosphoesterase [Carnobacteriaceae bacterium zg-ZUI252]|nr:metallophosphoesterase [Carnobacteriaceae bacterium zg-ZUI252]QTU83103.1 metallophosphoesterase [Carnobacteriaceae bacterium zg-C25]